MTLYDGSTRSKPEVCGIDGVAITGAGGFGQNDGGTMRFYGTSAAAPHVAAVAALAMEKNPALSASEVAGIINSNSADLGTTGYDYVFGNGLADAFNIANNSSPGQFAFTSAGFSVGEGGGSAVISVSRTGGGGGAAEVSYATNDGSATAGSDYTGVSDTLNFGIGETEKTFTVPILEDGVYEGDEVIDLALSNPTGGVSLGGQNRAKIIISENDAAQFGQLAFSSDTYSVGEGGGSVTVNIDRTGGSDGTVTVNYATSNGSATAGNDYTAASGTLAFGNGETTKSFTVPILEDSVDENNETVNLTLSSPGGGATLGGQSTAVITITDNDASSGGGGGGGSTLQPEGESVDDGGGTVKESGVTITVPAGAVDEEIRVQVEEVTSVSGLMPPKNGQLVSRVVEIVKDVSGNFDKPVTITMNFDRTKVDPDQYTFSIYWYDESAGKWVELENVSVDMAAGRVSGDAVHFTKFAVIAVKKPVAIPSLPPVLRDDLTFKDISGHWAEANIKSLVASGAVSGYPDGTFRPDGKITRAEFAAMLVKALGLQSQGGKLFSDTAGHWAGDFISTAAALEIVNGYPEGNFRPDDLINREQMAVMTVKAAGLNWTSGDLTFADTKDISGWALEAVAIAAGRGIMKGYPGNLVRPGGNATRAEAVTVIVNALNNI